MLSTTPDVPLPGPAKYDAFISYSHAADTALARALQSALHTFAKPWYRLRSLHVFRDETSLAANPALWPSIERALAASRWFVYLASPRAGASHWVQREVEWWLAHRGAGSMLVVLSGGTLRWDDAAADFDWTATDVLPRELTRRFSAEPLWVDLTWASRPETRSVRHSGFRAAVLRLASAIHGRDPEDLDGEDLRVFRRNRATARAAIVVLGILTVASVTAAYLAVMRSRESISRELATYSVQQLETDPELSLRLAMRAVETAETQQAEEALRRALAESQVLGTVALPGQVSHTAYSDSGRTLLIVSGRDVWLSGDGEWRSLQHPALVWRAEFSRDGTLVATGSWDGKARIWSVTTGQKLAEMQAGVAKSDDPADAWIVEEARFSPDATRLVTRGGNPASDDTRVAKVWDTKSGSLLATLHGHTGSITSVTFSSDGTRVATGGWDRTIRIWDAATGAPLQTLRGHMAAIDVLRYSPDGRWLFSGSHDLTVRKWDAVSGALRTVSGTPTTKEGLGLDRFVVLSPSTARALVHDETSTALYDLAKGELMRTLADFPGSCSAAKFSLDDRLVACPGRGGDAFVWSVDTGRRIATLRGHHGDIEDLALSLDNESVVTAGSDGTARKWTLRATDLILEGHSGTVGAAAWSPDGRLVATASYDGTARVWDSTTGAAISVIAPRPAGSASPAKVAWVSFAADSRRLLVASRDGGADIWNAESGAMARPLERVNPAEAGDERLIDIEWGPSDASLVGVVNVLSEAQTPPAGTSPGAKFSAGDRLFRWDAASGRLLPAMMTASPLSRGPQQQCAFSRASGLFCLEVGDGLPVHVWDVSSGSELAQFTPHLESVFMAAMTNDGSLLAMSDQAKVEIWQARTGIRQAEIPDRDDQFVTVVAFDTAGRKLISGGGQATPLARVWDALSGRLLRELRGHTHGLTAARFSPDGLLAVTASQDTTARVWRLSDGQAIATLRGHRDMVMDALFSPDGQHVLTASSDGTARVFSMSLSVSVAQLRALASRRQTRELTAREREQFLH